MRFSDRYGTSLLTQASTSPGLSLSSLVKARVSSPSRLPSASWTERCGWLRSLEEKWKAFTRSSTSLSGKLLMSMNPRRRDCSLSVKRDFWPSSKWPSLASPLLSRKSMSDTMLLLASRATSSPRRLGNRERRQEPNAEEVTGKRGDNAGKGENPENLVKIASPGKEGKGESPESPVKTVLPDVTTTTERSVVVWGGEAEIDWWLDLNRHKDIIISKNLKHHLRVGARPIFLNRMLPNPPLIILELMVSAPSCLACRETSSSRVSLICAAKIYLLMDAHFSALSFSVGWTAELVCFPLLTLKFLE